MGSRVNFTNHVEISDKTFANGVLKFYGYNDITDEFINDIVTNEKVKYIQISKKLPDEAFGVIDRILEKRSDMCFRIYGLYGETSFDLSCLKLLKNLKRLTLDVNRKDNPDMLDLNIISEIEGLKELNLSLFDIKDYSFINNVSNELEKLSVYADTSGGAVKFDCKWLSRFEKLGYVALGKKAKKNIKSIADLPNLKSLHLRGIKLDSFDFLRAKNIEELKILWCGMNDLSSLSGFESIKSLELWRIMKLENISFISTLTGLETLILRDLNRITNLPDMSKLTNIKDITLDNVPIDLDKIDEHLRKITHR